MSLHGHIASERPTLLQLFPGGSDRRIEFILAEQIGARTWRVRSRSTDQDVPQSTFALTEATVEEMREQAQIVADRCGLVTHFLPSQPRPFHAPAVILLAAALP